ncbi:Methyltransferase domain-containing protein [Selenomonas sp. GACV-9]|uniref:class I SAM-dependent methyltransferase n=1 Tax=Selenomonas sp. GACV-9 TaxID=3158782 RepID=UPI0008E4EA1D|nr:Methyltransferase domain-containing protein [Selenomonas ruminantium]
MQDALQNVIENEDRELSREIEGYWDARSHAFSQTRLKELAGPSAAAWTQVLQARLPQGRPLRILDIGTGAGFFAILLARLGHQVTGIDMSADMLHEAKCNALAAGISARFLKMNAQELDFAEDSFDVVVSRNLTWTLPDAMEAYRQWQRVLKPGGLLMNFDSDYGQERFSRKEDQENVHANISQDLVDACNKIKDAVRISTHRRPAWDVGFLQELGMQVEWTADIAPQVHNDPSMHYDNVPLFAIYAYK